MFSKKQNQLLARVNFPLYTIHCLTERHILVAGGGGSAKTGIPNVIQIYELINNGTTCRAESVTHFETGSEAIMNCTVFDAGKYFLLFAGMEGNCHVYKIKHSILNEGIEIKKDHEKQNQVIQRKNKISPNDKSHDDDQSRQDLNGKKSDADANANVIHSRLCFDIKHLESFQTDFSAELYQKQVRFTNAGNLLVTAGADGHIRIWKHPKLNKVYDIKAHDADIGDLDICPLGKRMVSVSRDGHGKIWSLEDGSLILELKYVLPAKSNVKYTFRNCRFGIVEDKNDLALFATLNPVPSKPSSQCYIAKWETKNFDQQKIVAAGTNMFSAMAVSDNGHFLGLGTQSGSVKIYIAFSLQQVYNVDNVHGIFVTGLEFLPTRDESRRITGGHETSLLSISIDNHVIIHYIPMRPSMGILTLITMFILTLFIIFVLMDYLNL